MIYVRLELTLWAVSFVLLALRPFAVVADVLAPQLRRLHAGHSHRRIRW